MNFEQPFVGEVDGVPFIGRPPVDEFHVGNHRDPSDQTGIVDHVPAHVLDPDAMDLARLRLQMRQNTHLTYIDTSYKTLGEQAAVWVARVRQELTSSEQYPPTEVVVGEVVVGVAPVPGRGQRVGGLALLRELQSAAAGTNDPDLPKQAEIDAMERAKHATAVGVNEELTTELMGADFPENYLERVLAGLRKL